MPVEPPNLTLGREGFMRFTTSWVWSALVGGALLAACERQPNALDPDFGVTSVGVTPQTYTLQVGDSVQLTATVVTSNGRPPHNVSWTSSAAAIASVSASGMVRGRAAGAARVYAASGSKKDSAVVTVTSSTPPPPVPVALVTVTPATASMAVGGTVQLAATPKDASGNVLAGLSITWTSSNTGVSAVSGSGLVTGVAAGSATIGATSDGITGTGTVSVTTAVTNPATVTDLAVASVTASAATLAFTDVNDGTGQPASYYLRYAAGTMSWGSATELPPFAGGAIGTKQTVTVPGLTAGTAYQFQVVAYRGTPNVDAVFGGLSNVASGTTSASTAPVASVTVSPASASVAVGTTQQFTAALQDAAGNALTGRTVTWTSSSIGVATVSGGGLVTGLVAGTVTITATSETKAGTATLTVTAASGGGGTILFQESFEDNAFAARGWYDNAGMTVTDTGTLAGSTHALEAHFRTGAQTPTWGGAARHLFTPSSSVYISLWVRYSANWVGSGHPYHPHEFMVLSNLDDDYAGPSVAWLNLYLEHNYQNGGIPVLALQDSRSINTSSGALPNNLVGITENRSTGGCNGVVEANVSPSCYSAPPWTNFKTLFANQVAFQPTPGPGYKGNWNHVEAYYQLNSVVGGVGQADGVMQYWFNGTLLIDRHDIQFRTGAQPNIQFHQFLIAPYIGDGSPVDQYLWVDNLTVATSKP